MSWPLVFMAKLPNQRHMLTVAPIWVCNTIDDRGLIVQSWSWKIAPCLGYISPWGIFFQGDGGDDLQEQLQIDVSFYVISLRHVRFFYYFTARRRIDVSPGWIDVLFITCCHRHTSRKGVYVSGGKVQNVIKKREELRWNLEVFWHRGCHVLNYCTTE